MKLEKKYLVPAYLQNAVWEYLLDENETDALFGTVIENMNGLSVSSDPARISETTAFARVFMYVKAHAKEYPVLEKALAFPAFVKPVHEFYRECIRYGISMEDLPEDADAEKELKQILKGIDGLELPYRKDREEYLIKKQDAGNYTVMDGYYESYEEMRGMNEWKSLGAKVKHLPSVSLPEVLFRKASTRQKEIDAAARFLVQHQNEYDPSDIQVIISTPEYAKDLTRIFREYQIPYELLAGIDTSLFADTLLAYFTYCEKPEKDYFVQLLRRNPYGKSCDYLADYLEYFGFDPEVLRQELTHVKDHPAKFFDRNAIDSVVILEERAEKERIQNGDLLEDILSGEDFKTKALRFMNRLIERMNSDRSLSEYEIETIRSVYGDLTDLIREDAPAELYKSLFSATFRPVKVPDYETITVTDTNHILPGKKLTVILGASEGEFMASTEHNGLINETYLEKVAGYPSLEERLEVLNRQAECLGHCSERIVVSYAYSDLAGKGKELSMFASSVFGKTSKEYEEWEEYSDSYTYNPAHVISEGTGKDLFIDSNGVLRGSVSSLETYRGCPYAYFLKTGIGINELKGYPAIDAAAMGTLRHSVFEALGNHHFEGGEEELEKITDSLFEDMMNFYPDDRERLWMVRESVKEILKLRLRQAVELEKTGKFRNTAQELKVEGDFPSEPYPIHFKGTIDRIDESDTYYRIIDYKSSDHRFNYDEFKAGNQLQLMVYAWLANKRLQKKIPFGMYYFMLNAAPYDKEFDEDASDEEKWNTFVSKNKLYGWQFEDSDQDQFIQPDFIKADPTKKARKEDPDFPKYSRMSMELKEVLNAISADISSGKIDVTPDKDGCRFCVYDAICRKRGNPEETEEDDE